MANIDTSLYGYDVGFYESCGMILPGKMLPDGAYTISKRAIDAAREIDIDPSDVLSATYPKTGWYPEKIFLRIGHVRLLPPATKLREGNVFTPVCHSVHRGICVWGSVSGGSLSGGSLSKGVSVQGGLCPGGC